MLFTLNSGVCTFVFHAVIKDQKTSEANYLAHYLQKRRNNVPNSAPQNLPKSYLNDLTRCQSMKLKYFLQRENISILHLNSMYAK